MKNLNFLLPFFVAVVIVFGMTPRAIASDFATVRITDISTNSPVRDQIVYVTVQLTNIGTSEWAPIGTSTKQETAAFYCELTIAQSGRPMIRAILTLPQVVRPGETVIIKGGITAPTIAGRYILTAAVLKAFNYAFCEEHLRNVEHECQICPTTILVVQ